MMKMDNILTSRIIPHRLCGTDFIPKTKQVKSVFEGSDSHTGAFSSATT